MKKKKTSRKCPCCGKDFIPETNGQRFCDKACAYAYKSGITRKEWLLEHNQFHSRRCHDCGKPTDNYRCPKCWEKIRKGVGSDSVYDETYSVLMG